MTTTTDRTQGGALGHLSNTELIARVQAKLDKTIADVSGCHSIGWYSGQASAFRQVLNLLKANMVATRPQEAK
jgi:hypothetical protein